MRLRSPLRSLLLCAGLMSGLLAADGPSLATPLVWKPTSKLLDSVGTLNLTPFTGKQIVFLPITDTRKDKTVIGENREKAQVRYVTTSDDVPAYLTKQLVEQLQGVGLPIVDKPTAGSLVVSSELVRFSVIETGTYQGELRLILQVKAGDKVVWRGMVSGKATRFGRSYKLENYHEVLSDTVMDVLTHLLTDEVFMSVLAGKARVVAVP
ncbi:hypothetical protein [Geothrix fuzhouensis]|uniref:hypothetical protein n=1 Tax=Geothrix fuzhouensis TaxID=2966451 RepID=UPI0021495FEB|nr:hypothetical protein [Geothrix fuzhouensis]